MTDVKKKRPDDPFLFVCKNEWKIVFAGLYHIFTLLCLGVGIFYGVAYMKMRDHVLFQDICGNLYRGYTTQVICKEVEYDIAKKAAFAFLNVSYLDKDKQNLDRSTLFTKSACNALRRHQRMLEEELMDQKITQSATIDKMQILPCDIEDCSYVRCKGLLSRTGEYMGLPYKQILKYEMLFLLFRTGQSKEFPMKVKNVKYVEKAIYSDRQETSKQNITNKE